MEICEATTGSQTPGYSSLKTPRKFTLQKKTCRSSYHYQRIGKLC